MTYLPKTSILAFLLSIACRGSDFQSTPNSNNTGGQPQVISTSGQAGQSSLAGQSSGGTIANGGTSQGGQSVGGSTVSIDTDAGIVYDSGSTVDAGIADNQQDAQVVTDHDSGIEAGPTFHCGKTANVCECPSVGEETTNNCADFGNANCCFTYQYQGDTICRCWFDMTEQDCNASVSGFVGTKVDQCQP